MLWRTVVHIRLSTSLESNYIRVVRRTARTSLTTADAVSTVEQSPKARWPMHAGCLQSVFHSETRYRGVTRVQPDSLLPPVGASRGADDFRGVLTVAKGKRTFQPNNRRRARVHGFRLRMRTRAGRSIVSARRGKGRKALTA